MYNITVQINNRCRISKYDKERIQSYLQWQANEYMNFVLDGKYSIASSIQAERAVQAALGLIENKY